MALSPKKAFRLETCARSSARSSTTRARPIASMPPAHTRLLLLSLLFWPTLAMVKAANKSQTHHARHSCRRHPSCPDCHGCAPGSKHHGSEPPNPARSKTRWYPQLPLLHSGASKPHFQHFPSSFWGQEAQTSLSMQTHQTVEVNF